MEVRFENRVNGGQQRLNHVVEHVRKADGGEDREHRPLDGLSLDFIHLPAGNGGHFAHLIIHFEFARDQLIRAKPRAVVMEDVDDENFIGFVFAGDILDGFTHARRRSGDDAAADGDLILSQAFVFEEAQRGFDGGDCDGLAAEEQRHHHAETD